jgi:23S rRNA pseudouridine1911/1915/1917 synthase
LKQLSNIDNLIVLFEDNHIIAVNKRVGDIVQGDKTGDNPLSEIAKSFLKKKYKKPNNVFLGVIHRIDRPTSGVVIFAKTSKSLKRLNNMIKNSEVEKLYWAITKNKPEKTNGTLVHWLKKNSRNNKSTHFKNETENSKKAILHYKVINELKNYYLLEVILETGRHHQIRTQLSAIGCPIKGDLKYGYERSNKDGGICLHAKKISFLHPVTKKKILISAPIFEHDIWKEI